MKRDTEYYRNRLKRDFPKHYADLLSGRYKTVRAAAISAGIIRKPTALKILKREWRKATSAEQDEFRRLVCGTHRPATALSKGVGVEDAIGKDRHLLPDAAARVGHIMNARRISMGVVMREMGFSPLNASLGNALAKGKRILDPAMDAALRKWLMDNKRH